jgi:hypothetical protein
MTHLTKITLKPPVWTVQFNLYKSLYEVFVKASRGIEPSNYGIEYCLIFHLKKIMTLTEAGVFWTPLLRTRLI